MFTPFFNEEEHADTSQVNFQKRKSNQNRWTKLTPISPWNHFWFSLCMEVIVERERCSLWPWRWLEESGLYEYHLCVVINTMTDNKAEDGILNGLI